MEIGRLILLSRAPTGYGLFCIFAGLFHYQIQ
jgi:hypothetical protein